MLRGVGMLNEGPAEKLYNIMRTKLVLFQIEGIRKDDLGYNVGPMFAVTRDLDGNNLDVARLQKKSARADDAKCMETWEKVKPQKAVRVQDVVIVSHSRKRGYSPKQGS
jgi:hypothetical protein